MKKRYHAELQHLNQAFILNKDRLIINLRNIKIIGKLEECYLMPELSQDLNYYFLWPSTRLIKT